MNTKGTTVITIVCTPYLRGNIPEAAISPLMPLHTDPAGSLVSALRTTIGCEDLSDTPITDGIDMWHATQPGPQWIPNTIASDAAAGAGCDPTPEVYGPVVFTGCRDGEGNPSSLDTASARVISGLLNAAVKFRSQH